MIVAVGSIFLAAGLATAMLAACPRGRLLILNLPLLGLAACFDAFAVYVLMH